MFLFDLFLAFLVGTLFAKRNAARGRLLALTFAGLGLAIPSLPLILLWPEWYLHYHVAAGEQFFVLWTGMSVGFALCAFLGNLLPSRVPYIVPASTITVSLYMWSTVDRSLRVGTREEWLNQTAPLLPSDFLGVFLAASTVSVLLFVAMWRNSRPEVSEATLPN